jgi:hypothetical protein
VNTEPLFRVPTSPHDVPQNIAGAITVEVAQAVVDANTTLGLQRLTFIVALMAERMTWDQQRLLAAALGYDEIKEPHPGPVPAEKNVSRLYDPALAARVTHTAQCVQRELEDRLQEKKK